MPLRSSRSRILSDDNPAMVRHTVLGKRPAPAPNSVAPSRNKPSSRLSRSTRNAAICRALLTDTGRMSAEDLVEKHLGVDIREPGFWQESLNYVEEAVVRLERLV